MSKIINIQAHDFFTIAPSQYSIEPAQASNALAK